jgi:hypothetical protein
VKVPFPRGRRPTCAIGLSVIRPLALPGDPGAGEQILRRTLSERLVSKLAEGTGDKPAVALRRSRRTHPRIARYFDACRAVSGLPKTV